ncbi:MAG: ECF transporter S component [Erysipelotrichaceae bacterium]
MKRNEIVIYGMGIAVVFVSTFFVKIPNAIDGYMNLGDGMIMLFSSIASPLGAFLIGGVGSAMADLVGGYPHYVIFTLLIKGLEGIVISILYRHLPKKIKWLTYFVGSVIMVVGYFFAKWYLKQNMLIALSGVPENILQSGIGIVIAILCIKKFYAVALDHNMVYKNNRTN